MDVNKKRSYKVEKDKEVVSKCPVCEGGFRISTRNFFLSCTDPSCARNPELVLACPVCFSKLEINEESEILQISCPNKKKLHPKINTFPILVPKTVLSLLQTEQPVKD